MRNNESTPAERVFAWFGCALICFTAGYSLWWAQTGYFQGASPSRAQSVIAPAIVARAIWRQFFSSDFARFNIPLLAVAVSVAWLLACVGAGLLALPRLLRLEKLNRFELPAFAFALGFLILGLLLFFSGILGFAGALSAWCILAAGVLSSAFNWSLLVKMIVALPRPVVFPIRSFFCRNLLFILLLFFSLFMILYALTPPIQSDALRYHLAVPQEYLKRGRIFYLPLNAFSNFPFLAEMHFMLALACGAPEAAQLMQVCCCGALVLSLAGFCNRFVDPLRCSVCSRISIPLLYLGIPAAFIVSSWPFIDQAVTLFFFLSLYALLVAFDSGRPGTWVFAGAMLGAAAGCKYTAMPFAVFLASLIVVERVVYSPPLSSGLRRTIRLPGVLAYVAVAGLLASPWLLKNAIFTSNPFYPMAQGLFGGGDWTRENAQLYAAKIAEKGLPKYSFNLPVALIDCFFRWMKYENHFPGTLFLPLTAAAMLGGILVITKNGARARFAVYLALSAVFYYLLWFYSYQSNRMLLPLVAFMIPLCFAFLREVRDMARVASVLSKIALFAAAFHGICWAVQWEYVLAWPRVVPYLAGNSSREQYVATAANSAAAFEYLNERVKPGERVLMIGEHRVYGAKFDAIWSDWYNTPALLEIIRKHQVKDVTSLVAVLDSLKIDYILYNRTELKPQLEQYFRPRFSDAEWNLLQQLLQSSSYESQTIPPGILLLHRVGGGTSK
jgi:hypothetical protein